MVPARQARKDFRSLQDFGKKLDHQFYQRPAIELAPALLGKILVRQVRGRTGRAYRARIVETEAYVGVHDLACHASKVRTRRTGVRCGSGCYSYVYFISGMYCIVNLASI